MHIRHFCCAASLALFGFSPLAAQPAVTQPAVTQPAWLPPVVVAAPPEAADFPGGVLREEIARDPHVAPASHEYYGPPPVVDGGITPLPPCDDCPCCHCAPCECPCEPAACLPCPRINLLDPCWQMLVGGNITLDMLSNTARPVATGTPFFLSPDGPFDEDTFDMHARQSTLYFALMGPEMGNFRAGGLILVNFYNDAVVVDRYGILPIQVYGELKNETWRFAGGLQSDIFAPLLPTVLPFSYLMASGNPGVFRGQLRAERYFYPAVDEQITFTAGISEATPTVINDSTAVPGSTALNEDNGWPNLEMRLSWGVGEPQQVGLEAKRPFEIGLSTVLGQIRTTFAPPLSRVENDVWGVAVDFRWRINDRWGCSGELFHGQTIGGYGGAVFQNVNTSTFQTVHAIGGWGQVDYYFTPCLHSHFGLGLDDPADSELFFGQIARNRTLFGNLIWDVNQSLRIAGELTFRDTGYIGPAALIPDNDGVGLHGQVQWKF